MITSISIIIINGLFYTVVFPIISRIGYHTKTEENRLAQYTIFVCLCIDMIILPILIGTNLSEIWNYKFSKNFIRGKYTDFDAGWYPDIGR